MKTLNFFDVKPQQIKNPIVTMGFFDGVHMGHQQLIERVVHHADALEGEPTVVTFIEHPLKTITGSPPPTITSLRKRLQLFARFGITHTLLIEFNQDVAQIDPQEFVEKFLVTALQIRGIVIGGNFRFGYKGAGTPELLEKMSAKHSFFVDVQSHRQWSGNIVSSTKIRKAIKHGDCRSAHEMLSRPFSLCGTVIEGQKRGRELGFPTANLQLEHTLVPGDGVYIGVVDIKEQRYPCLISVGTNPTFDGQKTSTEVYIEGFSGDLYHQDIEVLVLDKIRDQIKFNDVDELVVRMNKDKEVLMQKFDTLMASISAR